jgi:hypothetical protein
MVPLALTPTLPAFFLGCHIRSDALHIFQRRRYWWDLWLVGNRKVFDPDRCGEARIVELDREVVAARHGPATTPYYANAALGAADKVPQLRLYTDNDCIYEEALICEYYQAFTAIWSFARLNSLNSGWTKRGFTIYQIEASAGCNTTNGQADRRG